MSLHDVGTIWLLHGSDHCNVYSTSVSRVAVLLCGPKINMVLTLQSSPLVCLQLNRPWKR